MDFSRKDIILKNILKKLVLSLEGFLTTMMKWLYAIKMGSQETKIQRRAGKLFKIRKQETLFNQQE